MCSTISKIKNKNTQESQVAQQSVHEEIQQVVKYVQYNHTPSFEMWKCVDLSS
jgi:hypothetical protein